MSMQPPENAKLFDAPNGTVWMDEDGIIYSVPKPNERAPTREESEYQIALFKKLTNNEKKCIIVETNPKDPLPKKEDRDWVSAELESIMIAMAVIYTSPVGRMMANLFFGFKPATYPMKFFSNEKDAKEWIKQYLPKK